MRKSYDGLSAIVEHELAADPLSGHLFLFCNRKRNRMKVLCWDRTGLWVCAKRLEQGTFAWPQTDATSIEMTSEEFALLVGGIDLAQTKRRRWYTRRTGDKTKRRTLEEKLQRYAKIP
ncbi:MAG: IS66 family insertion sequence element accessory protein TnpB [bacterium]|nr:IS66 family insertion sequence element accessory protein TnpB [bacterium]